MDEIEDYKSSISWFVWCNSLNYGSFEVISVGLFLLSSGFTKSDIVETYSLMLKKKRLIKCVQIYCPYWSFCNVVK